LPPTFLKGFWAARGHPEPQNHRFFIKSLAPHPLNHQRAAVDRGSLDVEVGLEVLRAAGAPDVVVMIGSATCKLLVAFFRPPGLAGISDFRVRSGLDLVVFGWFRDTWGRFGPIFGLPGAAWTDTRSDSSLIRH